MERVESSSYFQQVFVDCLDMMEARLLDEMMMSMMPGSRRIGRAHASMQKHYREKRDVEDVFDPLRLVVDICSGRKARSRDGDGNVGSLRQHDHEALLCVAAALASHFEARYDELYPTE
jgi:hypothetical protein